MSWDHLPSSLEDRVVSEISIASKLKSNKARKYKNNKPFAHDREWDSNKELARYEELLLLEKSGSIEIIRIQPIFELTPTIKHYGKTYRKRSYKADFMYYDNELGMLVIEDVKSKPTTTQLYTLKRSLLIFQLNELNKSDGVKIMFKEFM